MYLVVRSAQLFALRVSNVTSARSSAKTHRQALNIIINRLRIDSYFRPAVSGQLPSQYRNRSKAVALSPPSQPPCWCCHACRTQLSWTARSDQVKGELLNPLKKLLLCIVYSYIAPEVANKNRGHFAHVYRRHLDLSTLNSSSAWNFDLA